MIRVNSSDVKKWYDSGVSVTKIAKEQNIPKKVLLNMFSDLGLDMDKRPKEVKVKPKAYEIIFDDESTDNFEVQEPALETIEDTTTSSVGVDAEQYSTFN